MSATAIEVLHSSMRGRSRAPIGFGSQEMPHEHHDALQRIALSTFTDMINNGNTFQDAIAAVYYSGIVHALESQP